MRQTMLSLAEQYGLLPSDMRTLLCDALLVEPDSNNWSERPNIRDEVAALLRRADWDQVYDFVESVAARMAARHPHVFPDFRDAVNAYFRRAGIGWQMVNRHLEVRGEEAFEAAVRTAGDALAAAGRATARQEIHEALADMGRRPTPDLTGAVHHAMAALECVARDVAGDPKATLGEVIRRHPGLLPKPLDGAVEKTWGYASERARHVREGHTPSYEDAELTVGLAATLATYLSRRAGTAS